MFENLIERMLAVEQSVEVQLSLGVAFAIFWALFFELLAHFQVPWSKKQRWYKQMVSIFEFRGKNYGIVQGDRSDEAWEEYCATLYSNSCAAAFQHFVGGLMAFPFILGIDTAPYTGLQTYQWVMLGGLSELGWEYYEFTMRVLRKEGTAVLVVCLIHHAIAQLLVIPCNLYFVTWGYAASIANLQGIASFAIALSCYGVTINLEESKNAHFMALIHIFYAFLNVAHRGFVFTYVSYCVILELYAKEFWIMLVCGLIGSTCMMLFSILKVYDSFRCAIKYSKLAWGNVEKEEKKELVRQLTQEMGSSAEQGKKLVKQLTGTGNQLIKQLTGSGSSLIRQLTGTGLKQQM